VRIGAEDRQIGVDEVGRGDDVHVDLAMVGAPRRSGRSSMCPAVARMAC
jgi:hypothetical protein